MLKLTLVLLASMLVGTQARTSWTVYSWGNTSVTTIDSSLYSVSKNNSRISIRSNNTAYESCDLEINHQLPGTIQIASIGRKIFIAFRENETAITMLQLDPFLCLYNPLPSIKASQISLEPQLIAINNTLDVFLLGQNNCFPCRFDANGNQLKVTGQLPFGNLSVLKSFIVKEFLFKGQTRNYAYALNFTNGTASLKVLDQNFRITKELYFHHGIEALAAHSDSKNSLIAITYAGLGSPNQRVLALYNSSLELVFETRVKRYDGWNIAKTLLEMNSTGHSFVNFVQVVPRDLRSYLSYSLYNTTGFVKTNDVVGIPPNSKYDFELFLINEREYCSVFHLIQSSKVTTTVNCY